MDISKETSVEKLKALAYDQMAQLEVTQANLRALNQRIAELSEDAKPTEKTK
jgi:hypothetical protein